jgi:hypothetical protein
MPKMYFTLTTGMMLLANALTMPAPAAEAPNRNSGRIHGHVLDAKSSQPLSGVNIVVTSTTYGTASSSEGQFLLNLRPGQYNLIFRSIGYEPVQRE